jgi:hypothetical protein
MPFAAVIELLGLNSMERAEVSELPLAGCSPERVMPGGNLRLADLVVLPAPASTSEQYPYAAVVGLRQASR